MIHKDWKKRLRSFKKTKAFHLTFCGIGITLGVIAGMVAGMGTDSFLECTLLGTFFMSFMLSMFYISEIFLTDKSTLDENATHENSAKNTIKDENHYETYNRYDWDARKRPIWRLASEAVFNKEIDILLSTITYILENCSLSEEEVHYFIHDFPNELFAILTDYQKLRDEHQERMGKRIQEFISSKITEWKRVHIHPMQDVIEKECLQKLEKAYQKKEENIYITE